MADLAREPRPAQDVDGLAEAREPDPAREEEVHLLGLPELEGGGVFEEEGALLGEEEVEAGEVDLLLVGFDLGEVGVHGEVGGELRGDAPLHVESEVAEGVVRVAGQGVVLAEAGERRREWPAGRGARAG